MILLLPPPGRLPEVVFDNGQPFAGESSVSSYEEGILELELWEGEELVGRPTLRPPLQPSPSFAALTGEGGSEFEHRQQVDGGTLLETTLP